MAAILNAMAVLMNYAGGQSLDPSLYFTQADQITARIEVVYPQHRIVEELHVVYDSALNLVKYEHALDFTTQPSRTPSLVHSIFDLTSGKFPTRQLFFSNHFADFFTFIGRISFYPVC